ncbi:MULTISPECIES: RND family transporter [unclassified Oceanispirochaeta]|uniref:efflux RND transporter permease subunit n=1 Tax=unclassified Oceanispirochaeta TaxID=2635722 RepID=UPI0013141CD2|nr:MULTISPECIES: MMPL family transporter [unclassified Oceanispirochaeta]MBF9018831.1 MMPL family transporter [Oceanispirochaeta sp. M2]NPD75300.1 MMPL family transporter [Oceanispirochaeta sp. M1]
MKKEMNPISTFLARFVTGRPGWILLGFFPLLVLAVLAAGNIESKTDLQDMLPEDNSQVIAYNRIDEMFSGGATAIVTIEGQDRKRMIAAARDVVSAVRNDEILIPLTRAVNFGLDEEFLSHWGLMMQDPDDLERTLDQFRRTDLLSFFTALNDSVEESWTGDDAEEDLETSRQESDAVAWMNQMDLSLSLINSLLSGDEGEDSETAGRELSRILTLGDLYGFNDDGTMLMLTILPDFNIVEFDKILTMMERLKGILAEVNSRYPDVTLAYTGDIPIQADEQDALGFDMLVPALVALVLIFILFLASFSRIRTILFLFISLIAGIILTYGFVGITVRQVNMLTSIMAVLLVGLGVDYGIQVASNYYGFRRKGIAVVSAMKQTYERAGVGIILAALTTSVSFFVLAGTGSQAFRQFGFILGSGILFCLLVMIVLLPALIVLADSRMEKRMLKKKTHFKYRERRIVEYHFLITIGLWTARNRKPVLLIGAVITVALFFTAMFGLKIDYDLMSMEPQDMPSIVQYKKIMDAYGITPFQSMFIATDIEEARWITDELEKERLVADIVSVADMIPSVDEQRETLALLAQIRVNPQRYDLLPWTKENVIALADQIQRLEWNMIEMADLSVAGLGEGNRIQIRRDALIREIFGAETGRPGKEIFQTLISQLLSDPLLAASGLTELDKSFAPALDERIRIMTSPDRPVTVEDLPDDIYRMFFAENGITNLVYIYPRNGIMDNAETMTGFNDRLARIHPGITGSTQIGIAWMDEAVQATLLSGVFIFLTVLIFLGFTMRRVHLVVRAITPLVVGIIWMLGLYVLMGQSLNFLNLVVIPLVIGMGIDFGIHLTHRNHVEASIRETYRTTGKAVFLSGMTTLIGFGSLGLIGKFPSIASMGTILAFGIASCLAASYLILPAILDNSEDPVNTGEIQMDNEIMKEISYEK